MVREHGEHAGGLCGGGRIDRYRSSVGDPAVDDGGVSGANGSLRVVADGWVRLAGTTTSGSLRAKAEMIAQAVAGTSKVENRIISVPSRGRPAS
jgi:osmotically-inducible protein OsmY